jgi:glycosyltransferase involved in cell wall biosynthesis
MSSLDDSFGGVEVFAARFAQELHRRGYPVTVHCLAADLAPLGRTAVRDIKGIAVFSPERGPGFDGCIAENAATSRQRDEEIIFAIGTRDAFVYEVALGVGEALSIPVVSCHFNSVNERLFRAQLANRTNFLIGVASPDERAEFAHSTTEALRRIVRRSAAVVVPTDYMRGEVSGVCGDDFSPNTLVSFHGVPAEKFQYVTRPGYRGRLLHLSRMMYPQALSKNYLWSARFAEYVHRQAGTDVVLRMVGSGSGDSVLLSYLRELNATEYVQMTGAMAKDALPAVYADADVLLCPSMMESSCQSLVEAIMTGCVPLTLDFGGSAEIMRRLGLGELLIAPTAHREGRFDTVVPGMEHARDLLDWIRHDWTGVQELLRRAAELATREFSIERSTTDLLSQLRRRGLITSES